MLKGKVIVVTGSAGFVGSQLVKALQGQGATVIELDLQNGVDITDWDQIKDLDCFDMLFHLAARTFVPDSYTDPKAFYATNINGTLNVLELCRLYKARMIFASSYVYGTPQYLPIDEQHPISSFNPYASTKIICEHLCENFHNHFGVKVIIFRPFNIYGPGQKDSFLIPLIAKQAQKGLIILKDPVPKRDFVYIYDVIDAYLKVATSDQNDFDIFNIGSGYSYSVWDIVNIIKDMFKQHIDIRFTGEKRKNEVMNTIADISKARNALHWGPRTDFVDGIQKTVMSGWFV